MTRQIEPEWDDITRNLAEGFEQYGNDCCPGCGIHKDIVADMQAGRAVPMTWDKQVCYVCAEQDQRARIVSHEDEQWDKQNPDAPAKAKRPADGRRVVLRPLTPDELRMVRRRDG